MQANLGEEEQQKVETQHRIEEVDNKDYSGNESGSDDEESTHSETKPSNPGPSSPGRATHTSTPTHFSTRPSLSQGATYTSPPPLKRSDTLSTLTSIHEEENSMLSEESADMETIEKLLQESVS